MLEQKHRDNFKLLAETLLKTDIPLRMGSYFDDHFLNDFYCSDLDFSMSENYKQHGCGTACCAAGLAAITPELENNAFETSEQHQKRVFGIVNDDEILWEFAFGGHWPNDKKQAAARCMYLYEHGKEPDDFDKNDYKEYEIKLESDT